MFGSLSEGLNLKVPELSLKSLVKADRWFYWTFAIAITEGVHFELCDLVGVLRHRRPQATEALSSKAENL